LIELTVEGSGAVPINPGDKIMASSWSSTGRYSRVRLSLAAGRLCRQSSGRIIVAIVREGCLEINVGFIGLYGAPDWTNGRKIRNVPICKFIDDSGNYRTSNPYDQQLAAVSAELTKLA
jgi:hypothetical protein